MPLYIVRNDITKMECDAIVNAANPSLLGGGGVDGAIHKAAGKGLLEECKKLGGCQTGEAKITGAYKLPCKYVIHTVGPVWNGGNDGESGKLYSCYFNSLSLAKDNDCNSIAFPLISSGIYGYPKEEALNIATDAIRQFLVLNDMTVYLVIFDKTSFTIGEEKFSDIKSYIDDRYVHFHYDVEKEKSRIFSIGNRPGKFANDLVEYCEAEPSYADVTDELTRMIEHKDESFSQMLLRKIDEKGMTDAQCYKKANIDRKLFSKIRSDIHYKPSKPTAIAFAIALQLSQDETDDMLRKAGFALSHSSVFDIIIEYFIVRGNYNIFEINEALFAFDQPLLGI